MLSFAFHPFGPFRPFGPHSLRLLAAGCALLISNLGQAQTAAPGSPEAQPQMDLPRIELRAGMFRIQAQVASQPHQHQTGLMYRQSMPAHEGMLFAFPQAQVQCFWMKNTPLPLTAAFVADDGRIVNLADMQPLDTRSHCSSEPVRFVLEMNQGWFASKGIQAGSRLKGPPFQP